MGTTQRTHKRNTSKSTVDSTTTRTDCQPTPNSIGTGTGPVSRSALETSAYVSLFLWEQVVAVLLVITVLVAKHLALSGADSAKQHPRTTMASQKQTAERHPPWMVGLYETKFKVKNSRGFIEWTYELTIPVDGEVRFSANVFDLWLQEDSGKPDTISTTDIFKGEVTPSGQINLRPDYRSIYESSPVVNKSGYSEVDVVITGGKLVRVRDRVSAYLTVDGKQIVLEQL